MSASEEKVKLEVTDYYELRVLHSALWVVRFAENPVRPELPGSPLLANIANRIVEVGAKMEVERGHPERAEQWRIKIVPDSPLWQVIVKNANRNSAFWKSCSTDKKREIARTYLSPSIIDDALIEEFVRQVDANTID
jgi:hypothetical protein